MQSCGIPFSLEKHYKTLSVTLRYFCKWQQIKLMKVTQMYDLKKATVLPFRHTDYKNLLFIVTV